MTEKQSFKNYFKLYGPTSWPSWFGMSFLWFVTQLPYAVILKLGKTLGLITMICMKKRRRIVDINLKLCFPELTPNQRQNLVKENFKNMGIWPFETVLAWWASDKRITAWLKDVRGVEHIQKAIAEKKGIVLLSGHFTAMELGGRYNALHAKKIPWSVIYRRQPDHVFEHISRKGRLAFLKQVILRREMVKMIRCLKNKEGLIYLPDQNFEKDHSIFVPFFGIKTLTLTTTARIAKLKDVVVIPSFCFRTPDHLGYILEYQAPLKNFPSGDDEKDAIMINAIFEKAIRQHPEQYLWGHRRFKVRPHGEQPIY